MVRMWGQQSSDVSGTQEEQNIGHDQSVQAQTGTMLRPISVSETKIAGDKTQCPDAYGCKVASLAMPSNELKIRNSIFTL
eukprot:1138249-Pelagomonas_calceolata.AAC.1